LSESKTEKREIMRVIDNTEGEEGKERRWGERERARENREGGEEKRIDRERERKKDRV
jgi:hypothetical protein